MQNIDIAEVKDALAPLTDKIGEGATYTWELLVKAQFIEGWLILLAAFVLFIVAATLLYVSYRLGKKPASPSPFDDDKDGATIAAFLFGGAAFIGSFVALQEAVMHLALPEYEAIQWLLMQVR